MWFMERLLFMSLMDQRLFQPCQDCLSGRLTIKELSILIFKSYRQTQRTLKKVELKGMLAIQHGNLGKAPNNKTTAEKETEIHSLLKNDYYDFNLTHFSN